MQVAAVDAKLLGALLAGVRRAFPFVDPEDTEALMGQHSASLFTVTHTATFGVAVQALSLVFQLLDARSAVSDRFYRQHSPKPALHLHPFLPLSALPILNMTRGKYAKVFSSFGELELL